jgi:tetratricopeptide (TPR) repeat protein
MKRLAAVLVVLSALPGTALAGPTVWQQTKSPRVFREAEALDESERIVTNAQVGQSELMPLDVKRAIKLLDDADVRHSTSPSALFVMGLMLEELATVGLGPRDASAPFFEAVVAAGANGTMKGIAFFDLASVAMRRGDLRTGIDFYDDALAESPATVPSFFIRPATRGLLLANQAEAYMALGDISRAVEGYRAAVASTPPYVDSATTLFSLGVALDRSGDLDGGLEAVELAHKYEPDDKTMKGRGWTFMPAYDADWYWGLEALLAARRSDDPEAKAKSYADAIDHFATYVSNAPEKDPYVSIARGHVASIKKEAGKAEPMHTTGTPKAPASH